MDSDAALPIGGASVRSEAGNKSDFKTTDQHVLYSHTMSQLPGTFGYIEQKRCAKFLQELMALATTAGPLSQQDKMQRMRDMCNFITERVRDSILLVHVSSVLLVRLVLDLKEKPRRTVAEAFAGVKATICLIWDYFLIGVPERPTNARLRIADLSKYDPFMGSYDEPGATRFVERAANACHPSKYREALMDPTRVQSVKSQPYLEVVLASQEPRDESSTKDISEAFKNLRKDTQSERVLVLAFTTYLDRKDSIGALVRRVCQVEILNSSATCFELLMDRISSLTSDERLMVSARVETIVAGLQSMSNDFQNEGIGIVPEEAFYFVPLILERRCLNNLAGWKAALGALPDPPSPNPETGVLSTSTTSRPTARSGRSVASRGRVPSGVDGMRDQPMNNATGTGLTGDLPLSVPSGTPTQFVESMASNVRASARIRGPQEHRNLFSSLPGPRGSALRGHTEGDAIVLDSPSDNDTQSQVATIQSRPSRRGSPPNLVSPAHLRAPTSGSGHFEILDSESPSSTLIRMSTGMSGDSWGLTKPWRGTLNRMLRILKKMRETRDALTIDNEVQDQSTIPLDHKELQRWVEQHWVTLRIHAHPEVQKRVLWTMLDLLAEGKAFNGLPEYSACLLNDIDPKKMDYDENDIGPLSSQRYAIANLHPRRMIRSTEVDAEDDQHAHWLWPMCSKIRGEATEIDPALPGNAMEEIEAGFDNGQQRMTGGSVEASSAWSLSRCGKTGFHG